MGNLTGITQLAHGRAGIQSQAARRWNEHSHLSWAGISTLTALPLRSLASSPEGPIPAGASAPAASSVRNSLPSQAHSLFPLPLCSNVTFCSAFPPALFPAHFLFSIPTPCFISSSHGSPSHTVYFIYLFAHRLCLLLECRLQEDRAFHFCSLFYHQPNNKRTQSLEKGRCARHRCSPAPG